MVSYRLMGPYWLRREDLTKSAASRARHAYLVNLAWQTLSAKNLVSKVKTAFAGLNFAPALA